MSVPTLGPKSLSVPLAISAKRISAAQARERSLLNAICSFIFAVASVSFQKLWKIKAARISVIARKSALRTTQKPAMM